MAASKFAAAARVGLTARGLLYGLLGALAFTRRPEDVRGSLTYLSTESGRPMLIALGLGFLCYGGWRVSAAWFDTMRKGEGVAGVARRLGGVGCGLVYLGFAGLSGELLVRYGQAEGKSQIAKKGASTAMHLPGGAMVLWLVVAALAIAGVSQLIIAGRLSFLRRMSPEVGHNPLVKWCGRLGIGARGLVFLVLAYLFLRAAIDWNPSEAGDTADALQSVPRSIRLVIAAGLSLFGVYGLIEALFRRIGTPS